MGDADSALDDAIVAIGVGAFPSNAFWFFITSIVVGSGSIGGRVHIVSPLLVVSWWCVGEEAAKSEAVEKGPGIERERAMVERR